MTHWLVWSLVIACAGALWASAVWLNRRSVRAHEGRGDPTAGIVLFVEPIRWLFIIWGFSSFCRGLRQAGCRHRVELWRWSTALGALLVVPDLIARRRLERSAERLARHVDDLAVQHPGATIHLVGYSSGCYVALEACRRMSRIDALGRVVLLAGSTSRSYPLDKLAARAQELHSFHSWLDVITGIGPLLFGSNDRHWWPACGMLGFRNPPPFVSQHGWRPADLRLGYFGDHFTVTASSFVARRIAPILTRAGGDRYQVHAGELRREN